MIDEAIYTKLSSASTITAIVGSRIYRSVAPEVADLPCLVWDVLATEYIEGQTGSQSLAISRLSLTAIGKTALTTRDLREAVRQVLQGFSGVVASTKIHSIIDWNDEAIFEDEIGIWDGTSQCSCWHAVP
jgi:hypothetical protein